MKSVIAVQFARKLSGRTNYRRRLALLKPGLPRLVVRKTLGSIILQVIDFEVAGDKVKLTVTSKRLRELGWKHSCKNIPAAYLAGMLLAKAALSEKISEVTPDIGLQSVTRGGKIFAALKGAKDAGLNFQLSDEVVPGADALAGARIAAYAKSAKPAQFSRSGSAVVNITQDFEKVKAAIAGGQWSTVPKTAAKNNINKK